MNREIKFRAKRADGSSWAYGDLRQENSGNKVIMTNLSTWRDNVNVDAWGENIIVNPNTIGQYTCLHDKNNKEIYEGDIVLQQGYNGKKIPMAVRFENGAFIVGYHKGSSTRKTPMLVSCKCEVIGNIYDNPEFLTK